jgi:hypothetical protein
MPTVAEMRAELKARQGVSDAMNTAREASGEMPSVEEMRAQLKASQGGMPTVNESSDIGILDRLAVKNFGGTVDDQINYLRKSRPDLEIEKDGNEIVARKPGEPTFKKLDPSGFSLRDLPSDLGDVAYDLGSGALQTIATGAAGVAGGAGSLGVGAIPAAMGAGAATGVGLEGLRQKIGQMLGTAKDYDTTGLAISGVAGAASPLLFGTGASNAAVKGAIENPGTVGKILAKAGLGYVPEGAAANAGQSALAHEALAGSQKGILSGLWSKGVATLTGAAPSKVIEKATEEVSPTLVAKLSKAYELDPNRAYTNLEMSNILQKQGVGDLGGEAAKGIREALDTAKNETGEKINKALAGSDTMIDVAEHAKGIQEYIDQNLAAFERTKSQVFSDEAKKASEILETFKPNVQTPTTALLDASGNVIKTEAPKSPKYLMNAQDAFNFKNKLVDLVDYSKSPLVLDKKSATSKQLSSKLIEAERGLSDQLDKVLTDSGAPGAREAYKENRDIMRYLYPKFKDEDAAVKTLRNIEGGKNPSLRNQLKNFDAKYGTDNIEMADLANVWRHFGNASGEAISSGGQTSTGKLFRGAGLGAALGYGAGIATGIPGAAAAGGYLGGVTGGLATSPSVVKAGLQGKTAIDRLIQGGASKVRAKEIIDAIRNQSEKLPADVQPAVSTQTGLNSLWNMMNNKRGQQ